VNPESGDDPIERVKAEIRLEAARLGERDLLIRRDPPQRGAADAIVGDGIDRARLDYRIGELTDLHHRAFVDAAFRTLLKRTGDEREMAAQVGLLAAGAAKAELLGNLRFSAEGRRIGTRVGGLLPRYALTKLRRVPVLGYIVDWCMTLAGLPLIVRHQRATEALFAAGDQAAAEADRLLSARIDELHVISAGLGDRLQSTADELGGWLGRLQATAQELGSAGIAQRVRIETLENATEVHRGRLDELDFLRQRLYALNHWTHHLTQAVGHIESVATERRAALESTAASIALDAITNDPTRAARNAVWADALFTRLPERGSVLAIASGGDWLALLAARGAQVSAAEPNAVLAAAARNGNVSIEPAAAREVLSRCADATLDALTLLAFPSAARQMPIIDLFAHSHRVLRANGVLLLAFAREPAALTDALIEPAMPTPEPDLLARALAASGFIDIVRADAADGTIALFARNASF